MQAPSSVGSQRARKSCDPTQKTGLRDEERRAMPRLGRMRCNRRAAPDALVGRQRRSPLDVIDEEVEGALRVRLDELELREEVLERLDVVPVLHFVQAVRRATVA